MRLIDADLLKKNCKCTGKFEDNFKGVDLIELAKVIDAQPTAYDVDKVVAELEEIKNDRDCQTYCYEFYKKKCKNYDKAIDIVRKGGVE